MSPAIGEMMSSLPENPLAAGHFGPLEAWLCETLGATRVEIARAEKLSGGAVQENWRIDALVDHGLGVVREFGAVETKQHRRGYGDLLHEDLKIKSFLKRRFYHAGISGIEIERAANKLTVMIYTSCPGIIIGRKGSEI